jgi:O-antigen/teichoic acid export membrane protein
VSGFFGMGPILLAMCDSERHLTLIYAFSVGAGMLAAGPLIHSFGAAGAAGAQIVSTGLVSMLSGRFARRQLHLPTTFMGIFRSP